MATTRKTAQAEPAHSLPITAANLANLTPQAREALMKELRDALKADREAKKVERTKEREAREAERSAAVQDLTPVVTATVKNVEPTKGDGYWLRSGRVTVDGQEYAVSFRINKR